MLRAFGMILFWTLGIVTAFMGAVTVTGIVSLSTAYGWPPISAALTAATGIPMIFIWRGMIR